MRTRGTREDLTADIEPTTVRAGVEARQEISRAGSLPPWQSADGSGVAHDGMHVVGGRMTSWRVVCDIVLLAVVTSVLLVWTIGATPITTRGEAREALVVRELLSGGSWVVPTRQGRLATKPPLHHWLAATIAARRGLSDAAVRAPSALAALAVVLVTFALGSQFGGRRTAWVAAGVLAATSTFWRWGTEARVDMLLAACVTVSIAGFLAWLARDSTVGRVFFWLAAALGVLTKGPVGMVLPVMVAVVTALVLRAWPRWRSLVLTPVTAVAAVIVLGWYALAAYAGGAELLRTQLFVENFERLFGGGAFVSRADRSTFVSLRTFGSHLLPWNLALGWYAWRWWHGVRATHGERALHAWWMTTLVVLSLAAGQRPAYLLPLYAPIAVLAARALVVGVGPLLATRRARLAAACGLAVAGLGVLGVTQWWRGRRVDDAAPMLAFAAAVSARVSIDAGLRAAHAVDESDVLVLAHLVGRPLLRGRPECGGVTRYYLGPASFGDRASLRVVERMAGPGSKQLALLECITPASTKLP